MNINENVVVTTKDWLKTTVEMRITSYDPVPTKIPSADSTTSPYPIAPRLPPPTTHDPIPPLPSQERPPAL